MDTHATTRTVNSPGVTTTHVAPLATTEHRRIHWGPIMAGAVLALVVQLLLQMLGAGIGLSTIDPLRMGDTPSAATFGLGAAAWWAIGGLIAAYLGGWLAGKLANSTRKGDGAWHGLLSWAVSTLVTAYIIGTAATSLVSGAASTVTQAATATASATADAAATAPSAVSGAAQQAANAVRGAVNDPNNAQRAREVADATAKNASRAMLLAFAALALGSLLASLGGRAGAPRDGYDAR